MKYKILLFTLIVLCGVVHICLLDSTLYVKHYIRQFDTAAVARNFYEESMNIAYPRVDWRGETPGYADTEFPIYNFTVAVLYHVFGPHEWVGRALNIVFYVLTALLLFDLVKRLFDERGALLAVFFYSVSPMGFFWVHSFQPESLMLLGLMAGVVFFYRWLDENKWRDYALSVCGVALAVLIKPTCLYIGLPLLYLSYRQFNWKLLRRPLLWLYVALVLIPSALWYHHTHGLWVAYGNSIGIYGRARIGVALGIFDRQWLSLGIALISRLVWNIATPPGVVLFLVGLLTVTPGRRYLFHWWALAFCVSIVLAPMPHWDNDYYQLPSVLFVAGLIGCGASVLLEKKVFSGPIIAGFCVIAVATSVWQMRPWFWLSSIANHRIAFGHRVEQLTDPDARVIFIDVHLKNVSPGEYRHRTPEGEFLQCDPTDFYISHRKGWNLDAIQATPQLLDRLRSRGAQYLIAFNPDVFKQNPDLEPWLTRSATAVEVKPRVSPDQRWAGEWFIYRLNTKPRQGVLTTEQ